MMTAMENIKILIKFNSRLIYFNYEISRSHAIHNFGIERNNFSKKTPDEGRMWPKHIVKKKGD
jgi:hypothetical protein